MTDNLEFSDAELRARGFSRQPHLDRTCEECDRPVECWSDRAGNRAPFVRLTVAPGDAPRVRAHHSYEDCRGKITFFRGGDFDRAKGRRTPEDW